MKKNSTIEIKNKRAAFQYELLELYTAGIMLKGTEVKSLREGSGSIVEAYCMLDKGELYIKQMNIAEYSLGTYANHNPLSIRKLLLTKRELNKIDTKMRERGLAVIPVRLFFNERGFAKIEIAIARGKKTYDKRETIKQKDNKKEIDRVLKKYR